MTTLYFSPGPASLPAAVRNRIHAELLDTFHMGVSIMEISHRSKQYEELNAQTLELAKRVFEVPESHAVLFTPFGAQQHFSLILAHLSLPGDTVAYTDTGVWAHLAIADAKATGRNVALVYDSAPDHKSLGTPEQWKIPSDAKFLHLTINNTVEGTEFACIPEHVSCPLVLDMTSAIAARQDIPWQNTAILYASAQKNFGIAGCSVVVVRKDILQSSRSFALQNRIGNALTYASIYDAKSALNTPPVFSLYAANRMLQWIESEGGVTAMEKCARAKAGLVYHQVDAGFYKGRALARDRSRHNFVFSLPTPELDSQFINDAAKEGIQEIKGYRTTGGIRASMYNGVPLKEARIFAKFMENFRVRYG